MLSLTALTFLATFSFSIGLVCGYLGWYLLCPSLSIVENPDKHTSADRTYGLVNDRANNTKLAFTEEQIEVARVRAERLGLN